MTKLRGLVPYFGGKSLLAELILARIEAAPHHCYAEPFIGGGGMILRRRRPAAVEAINDLAADIVTMFRVAQRHPQALAAELRLTLHSRADFERLLRQEPADLTDIERAARFIRLQKARFGARPTSTSFIAGTHTARGSAYALRRHLMTVHRRLARVTIERLDFEAFLARYDGPRTLFYLDPPYWGMEDSYGKGLFSRLDFSRLDGALRRLRGRFVMSLNDRPEVRELFGWAAIEEIETTYTCSGSRQRAVELLSCSPADAAR